MLKKFLVGFVVVGIAAGGTWYYLNEVKNTSGAAQAAPKQQGGGQQQQAPVDVAFIELREVVLDRNIDLPGRVVSYQVAEIRPQVGGIVLSRSFEEGSFVEKGQQLYQIDPARYEAAYDVAVASLKDAQARKRNAQNLSDRLKGLVDINAVSQQEYDDAQAALDQAKAAVALAQAQVKTAKIDLDYTKVYAPISGFISPSNVTKGALVTAQQETPLATVRQLDPVYVDLSQSVAKARKLQEQMMTSKLEDNKTRYAVQLYIGDGDRLYPQTGTLDATDLSVEPSTGAIRLRSVFPNPDRLLLPGMFVRASIADLGRGKDIIVPQKAVTVEPSGEKTVWLIGEGDTAQKRTVVTGAAYEGNWIIHEGLRAGERVIVEGTMTLYPGASLKPQAMAGFYEDYDNSQEAEPSEDKPQER